MPVYIKRHFFACQLLDSKQTWSVLYRHPKISAPRPRAVGTSKPTVRPHDARRRWSLGFAKVNAAVRCSDPAVSVLLKKEGVCRPWLCFLVELHEPEPSNCSSHLQATALQFYFQVKNMSPLPDWPESVTDHQLSGSAESPECLHHQGVAFFQFFITWFGAVEIIWVHGGEG